MVEIFKKMMALLSPEERNKFYYLIFTMIISAIVEIAGIGSIMPFMTIITSPTIISENVYLSYAYTHLSFSSTNSFLICFGLIVLGILVINNVWTATVNWLIFRYTWLRNHSISKRLLDKYINQSYEFFLNRNTAELKKNIVEEVHLIIVGILIPLLMIIKSSFSMIFVVFLLFFNDPLLATIISVILGLAYFILYKMVATTLGRIGKERAEANRERFRAVEEIFGGIKELKILGREAFFIEKFSTSSYRLSNTQALKNSISLLPKYAIEVIAFGGIIIILLYYLAMQKDTKEIIPLMALYAFAGYRLMPALQTIFTGFSQIKYTIPALEIINKDFSLIENKNYNISNIYSTFDLKEKLSIRDLVFRFRNTEKSVISKLNIDIISNTSVGFIGTTGSGKTTLINLILGLLKPESGDIFIDTIKLTDINTACWQRKIGYVPQDIFLFDATIAENIAFGVGGNEIDMEKVIESSKLANLHDFIECNLNDGYKTVVGERGVKLSGGQKQRLGIARSLYHDPAILIFDEATSSLDNVTENEVIKAIKNLKGKKTIIMIAHRVSTLVDCQTIFILEKGKLVSQGSFDYLKENCSYFKKLTLQ